VHSAPRDLRILLSEGSSLSARETINALGVAGYRVDVLDPNPLCLGRLSRFVRRFHRCPRFGQNPREYLDFVLACLERERFDVLYPTHEQAYLFARVHSRLAPLVRIPVASFEAFRRVQTKAAFAVTAAEIGLSTPETRIVRERGALGASLRDAPSYVKMSVGTASRGVWRVDRGAALEPIVRQLEAEHAFDDGVVVQRAILGGLERVQSVFDEGRLVAAHASGQVAASIGGGDVRKESVHRPAVFSDVLRLGQHLRWHGGLSLDYIVDARGRHYFVDCNPRLAEPGNALAAGLDLPELLIRIALGEHPSPVPPRTGARTHMAIPALLTVADRTGSRRAVLRECSRLAGHRGPYRGSVESLTPTSDVPSTIAVTAVASALIAWPGAASRIAAQAIADYALTPRSIRQIEEL
jgi:carbamoylphosphate synthase large subunit